MDEINPINLEKIVIEIKPKKIPLPYLINEDIKPVKIEPLYRNKQYIVLKV